MRVLLINQFFWPDSAATSLLLTDVARGLAERGHQVTVICAQGGYVSDEMENAPAVRVHRVKALPFVRGSLGRVVSYASFFLTAAVRGLLVTPPDVVVTLTTPPLISLIGSLVQRLRGSRHFIWEMDIYPDVATDVDYFPRGGWIDRVAGAIADFSRHRCDGLLALGPCMKERLIQRGVDADRIHVAENWADSAVIGAQPLVLESGKLSLLYSGNLGLAHDVETLMEAIEQIEADGRFRFVFSGGGTKRELLEQWCQDHRIKQVEFTAYSSRSSLGAKLGSADIGLVTQHARCLGSVVPSKIYGLMAAGRPVLFIGPAASTVAEVIRRFGCGWHVSCGDAAGLYSLLRSLVEHPEQVIEAGYRGRQAFLRHYDRPAGVSRICRLIGAEIEGPGQDRHLPDEKWLVATASGSRVTGLG